VNKSEPEKDKILVSQYSVQVKQKYQDDLSDIDPDNILYQQCPLQPKGGDENHHSSP